MAGFPQRYDGEEMEKLEQSLREVMTDEQQEKITEYLDNIGHFYGVVPVSRAYKILTETVEENVSEEAFRRFIMYNRHMWRGHFFIVSEEEFYGAEDEPVNDEGLFDRLLISELYVQFPEDYERLKKEQADKPFKDITKEQVINYQNLVEFPNNEYTKAAAEYLTKRYGADAEKAMGIIGDIMIGVRMNLGYHEAAAREIMRRGYKFTPEDAKEFAPYFADMVNHANLSASRGHTPIEIEEMNAAQGTSYSSFYVRAEELDTDAEKLAKEQESIDNMKENLVRMRKIMGIKDDDDSDTALGKIAAYLRKDKAKQQPVKVTKVGRNDPCPCGSGKKYKKCCGR